MTQNTTQLSMLFLAMSACSASPGFAGRTVETTGADGWRRVRIVPPESDAGIEYVARARAALDFRCDPVGIRLDRIAIMEIQVRPGLERVEQFIFIAHACGHDAGYSCTPRGEQVGTPWLSLIHI